MTLEDINQQAWRYVGNLSSLDLGLPTWLWLDVKHNKPKYVEMIVLLHVNPRLNEHQISKIIGMNVCHEKLDLVCDFFLRDILNDVHKPRRGNEILSRRQLTRRRSREGWFEESIGYDS